MRSSAGFRYSAGVSRLLIAHTGTTVHGNGVRCFFAFLIWLVGKQQYPLSLCVLAVEVAVILVRSEPKTCVWFSFLGVEAVG